MISFALGFVIGTGVGLAVGGRYALRAVAAKPAPDYDPYEFPFGEWVTITGQAVTVTELGEAHA